MTVLLWLALLAQAPPAPALAVYGGTVYSGTVEDTVTHRPMAGVTLSLESLVNKGPRYSARSGDDGKFVIRDVAPGTYVVGAAFDGFSLCADEFGKILYAQQS